MVQEVSKIDTSLTRSELCLKCMECCKVIAVRAAINPDFGPTTEFYEARGCSIVKTSSLPMVLIPYPCPHLTDIGCDIYKTRPLACRAYDGRKDPVMAYVCLWRHLED